MSIFDAFEYVKIINLEKRPDRKLQIQKEIQLLEPSGNTPISFYKAFEAKSADGFPSIGAHGCFKSHLGVLKEALKKNVASVLVIEDDLAFTQRLIKHQKIVEKEIASLENKWDILYLGHPVQQKRTNVISIQPCNIFFQQIHFIAFNKSILPQLIDYYEKILERPPGHPLGGPMHVDGALAHFRKDTPNCRTFMFTPSLGFQRPSFSNIANDENKEPSAFRHLLQKIKTAFKRLS